MTNEDRNINVLWSGGLDSTFRIVELSRRKCTIQPYYIVFGKRKSLQHELNAINKITRILKKDKRTLAKLLEPIIVSEQEIARDTVIFDSWYRLMKGKSWQYYVFAKYVNQHHIEMEMGIQFSPNGSVAYAIDEALLIPHPDSDYDVLVIDKDRADKETLSIFGRFCFPKSLYHKTKREEIDILRREGYDKVVRNVWFCFKPVWGYPCGHCSPCVSFKNEGVKLPLVGEWLYAINSHFSKKKKHIILKLNYEYDIQEVSDVYVAYAKDRETGEVKKVFRLNETGVIILEALQDGVDIDEVAKRLTDGYDIDYETAKVEASKFITKIKI